MKDNEKSIEKDKQHPVKSWLKKNWGWIVCGAIAGIAVLAVSSGKAEDTSVIDPYVIDRGKDDWMDILKVKFRDSNVSVRQAANLADYYSKLVDWAYDHDNCLNLDLEVDFAADYSMTYPDKFENIELALI